MTIREFFIESMPSSYLKILRAHCTAFLLGCMLSSPQFTHASDNSSGNSPEFTPRDGLPNFFRKLDAGEDVTIAYLGGSITGQNGWRVLSQKWFEEQYPDATIHGLNAAIGGTGSDLGVFRVGNDALAAKPDLLFVEFAVNDNRTDPEIIGKAMEGIVRKTWKANPQTDICFVYTVTARESRKLANGTPKRSTTTMETVAEHYGIPSIHMGYAIALMEKEGTLVMKTNAPMTRVAGEELNESAELATDEKGRIIFSKDGVHPFLETGHVLYTDALVRSFKKIQDKTGTLARELVPPIRKDNWEDARQIPIKPEFLSGAFTNRRAARDPRFRREMKQLFRLEPGATLSFEFKGTDAAIYDLMGPDGCEVEIALDGETKTALRMDGYSTGHRLSRLEVGNNLEDKPHKVTIRALDTEVDKRSILLESNRGDFDKNPAKYAPRYWHVGAIFIVGDLVE
jgi:lysophospholipase L1-like esterase